MRERDQFRGGCRFGAARGTTQLFAQPIQSQTAFAQEPRGETVLLAQDSKKKVRGVHIFVAKAFGFLRRIAQNAFALRAQRHLDGSGDALTRSNLRFDFLANGPRSAFHLQEAPDIGLILAQKSKKDMLRLDMGAAVLAGFVTGEENYAAGLFRKAFEHKEISILKYPANGQLKRPSRLSG